MIREFVLGLLVGSVLMLVSISSFAGPERPWVERSSVRKSTASQCPTQPVEALVLTFLSRRPGGARDDNYDIYTAELDGSDVRRITDFPESSIRWFDRDPVRGRLVIAGSSDGDLSIGPSGRHGGAASGEQFVAILEQEKSLRFLIDIRSELLNEEQFVGVWHPTFAPDGNQIVFSGTKSGESANLWIIDSNGSGLRRLINEPNRTYNDPRFGPDGNLVYVRHDAVGLAQLFQANGLDVWLMDPDQPELAQPVTREALIPGSAVIETDPAMSPNCRWVASVRATNPFSVGSIFRPASDNVVFGIKGDVRGQFKRLQTGENPYRVHGVPTWQDSTTLLSYRWDQIAQGWRIIRYRIDSADDSVELLDLGAPEGSEDLLPLAHPLFPTE